MPPPATDVPPMSTLPVAHQPTKTSSGSAVEQVDIPHTEDTSQQPTTDTTTISSSFPLSNGNYLPSVDLPHSRFAEPHKLMTAHVPALIDLPNPSNSLTSLQHFHDSIESHTRSLTALEKNSDSYGDLLVPITLGKLPRDIKCNLARERCSEEWTHSDVQDALLVEIQILETTTAGSHKNPTASFLTGTCPSGTISNPDTRKKFIALVHILRPVVQPLLIPRSIWRLLNSNDCVSTA